MENITEQQRDEFAIGFADWLGKLRPSEMVSVWSKNGEYRGLFTMDNEQLLDNYKSALAENNPTSQEQCATPAVSVELPELCSQCFRRNVNNDKVCKCGKPFKGN